MKKKWLWLPVLAAVLLAVLFLNWTNSKAGVIAHVKRNLDELEAHAVGCMESPDNYVNYNGWDTMYRSTEAAVTFRIRYGGFGSQSEETGICYAPDDQPKSFGCELGREETETGVLFLGEGDNYVLAERIVPCWFWYEQHW